MKKDTETFNFNPSEEEFQKQIATAYDLENQDENTAIEIMLDLGILNESNFYIKSSSSTTNNNKLLEEKKVVALKRKRFVTKREQKRKSRKYASIKAEKLLKEQNPSDYKKMKRLEASTDETNQKQAMQIKAFAMTLTDKPHKDLIIPSKRVNSEFYIPETITYEDKKLNLEKKILWWNHRWRCKKYCRSN